MSQYLACIGGKFHPVESFTISREYEDRQVDYGFPDPSSSHIEGDIQIMREPITSPSTNSIYVFTETKNYLIDIAKLSVTYSSYSPAIYKLSFSGYKLCCSSDGAPTPKDL